MSRTPRDFPSVNIKLTFGMKQLVLAIKRPLLASTYTSKINYSSTKSSQMDMQSNFEDVLECREIH